MQPAAHRADRGGPGSASAVSSCTTPSRTSGRPAPGRRQPAAPQQRLDDRAADRHPLGLDAVGHAVVVEPGRHLHDRTSAPGPAASPPSTTAATSGRGPAAAVRPPAARGRGRRRRTRPPAPSAAAATRSTTSASSTSTRSATPSASTFSRGQLAGDRVAVDGDHARRRPGPARPCRCPPRSRGRPPPSRPPASSRAARRSASSGRPACSRASAVKSSRSASAPNAGRAPAAAGRCPRPDRRARRRPRPAAGSAPGTGRHRRPAAPPARASAAAPSGVASARSWRTVSAACSAVRRARHRVRPGAPRRHPPGDPVERLALSWVECQSTRAGA